MDQDYGDFEIIVVDGVSTDNTIAVVQEFSRADPRIRLIREERNRGVCPARNTGAAAARGEWMVMLDSDQSLRPGALTTMRRLTAGAPSDVGMVAARVVWDTGIVTPGPTLASGPLRYEKYLAWVDTLGTGEQFNCIRRQVWTEGIRWSDSRASEASFYLDLAARWRYEIHPEICSVYYTDAANSFCHPKSAGDARRTLMRDSLDHAVNMEVILRQHGRALAVHAPRQFYAKHYLASLHYLMAGHRMRGLKYWLKCLAKRPFSLHLWFLGPLGALGPNVLGYTYCWVKYSLPGTLRIRRRSCGPTGQMTAALLAKE